MGRSLAMIFTTLLVALTFNWHVKGQRVLSETEMIGLFGHQKYEFPGVNQVHTCAYLTLKENAYTANKPQYAQLECNCVRKISDCQGGVMNVTRKCCPGFLSFVDGSRSRCMERVLPLNRFEKSLNNIQAGVMSDALFKSSYGAAFNDSEDVFTVFAVRDSDGLDRSAFPQKESTQPDFTSPTFVHVAKGRIYTQALNQEHSIETLHNGGTTKNTNIKFTRYSNGIMCVECSVIKEANYEVANGVMHVVDSPFLPSAASKSIAQTLESDYGYFWSALSPELKAQLKSTICDGWFTVFVPPQAQWNNGNAEVAANHVIKGLWCTHGLVSQNSANLATLSGDVMQLGCSGQNRDQILISSNGRSATVDSSRRGRTFDIMATNGVIHLISDRLETKSNLNFRFAVQLDEIEATDPRTNLFYEFASCGVEFDPSKKYIVLMPTSQAMSKFYKYRNTHYDAEQYLRSEYSRCQLLMYHILITDDGLSDLQRVAHLQKTYKTMLGDNVKMSDFIMTSGEKVTPYFMNAKSEGSQEFANGHIYQIDSVLLPPSARRWRSMMAGRGLLAVIKRTFPQRMLNLIRMEDAVPEGHQCTHFVPPNDDVDDSVLKTHSAKYSLWTNYLRNGETYELAPCNAWTEGSRKLLLHRIDNTHFTLRFVGSNKRVSVIQANILRNTGVAWFINGLLH